MTRTRRGEGMAPVWYAGARPRGQTRPRYLFVYGTLMSGAMSALGREERRALGGRERQPRAGVDALCPPLRSGRYPGAAVSDGEEEIVHGEAVLLT